MREIKFRGQEYNGYWEDGTRKGGGWIYGDLHFNHDGAFIFDREEYEWHKVYPETIGQYTGVKDKNGKEIYEGDIVKTNWDVGSLIEIIFWHKEGAFRQIPVKEYRFYTERNNWIALWNFSKPVGVGDAEVIGNVYEHKHLLEGKDD